VRHHYQRQAAKHAVSRVKGVLGVDESNTLTSDPIPSDVLDRIHEAFQRSAIIDESTVEVRNVAHTIELDGSVRSWAAKDEAEEAAWQAPGVQLVVNKIQVES
jgi:osmotically-inducible protein OsmY